MLVSTRGAILGRYFKTEKQVLKYLKDSEEKLVKAGFKISPEYYDDIAVMEFKNGFLLTSKSTLTKHASAIKKSRGTGTHATNEKTVPNDSINKIHGSVTKRSKRNGGNYKKSSK